MSYQRIHETQPVARKEHRCIWCSEKIAKGEKHFHEISKYEGNFQNHRWHPECRTASAVFFRLSGDGEFDAHSFKRGTYEEA